MKLKELLTYGALERPSCDADPSLELSAESAPDEIMSRLFTYFGEDPQRSGVWLKLRAIRPRHFRREDLYALVPDVRKTLATEVESPVLRYLNLVLGHRRGTRLPATQALDEAASYQIVLWIGEHALESVVANAPAFPDVALPRDQEEHRLQIVAHSDDVVIAKPHRILRLPGEGDSPRISIGFRTPEDPGSGNVRIGIWHRRNLLQSVLLELRWGLPGPGQTLSHDARIDYTVSDLADLDYTPERQLSLLVNETSSGVHRVIVNGRDEAPFHVKLFEAAMEGRLAAAREVMLAAHRDGKGRTRYGTDNEKARTEFIKDLTELAHTGATLLESAFPDAARRNALVRRLREASADCAGRAVVQVAQAEAAPLLFPWHLVYDIGLEVFAHNQERLCRVLDAWRPFADPAEIPDLCPYQREHTLNTICPFGFWGFAHILELPPSTLDPSTSLPLCVCQGPRETSMAVALSNRLDASMTASHLERLPDGLRTSRCDDVPSLKLALAEPDREIVYFYCHGRREFTAAYRRVTSLLEIGDDGLIATGDLGAWSSPEGGWPPDHWERTKPLVIINGCHTVEVSPLQPSDFVSAFVGAGAAGVIGTEVMLDQPVASEAAEALLHELVHGASTVGEALRSMRRRLLAKGNVMGLAYTAYCSADLRLSCESPSRQERDAPAQQ